MLFTDLHTLDNVGQHLIITYIKHWNIKYWNIKSFNINKKRKVVPCWKIWRENSMDKQFGINFFLTLKLISWMFNTAFKQRAPNQRKDKTKQNIFQWTVLSLNQNPYEGMVPHFVKLCSIQSTVCAIKLLFFLNLYFYLFCVCLCVKTVWITWS